MSNIAQQEIATSDTHINKVRSRTVRFGTTRWLTYVALFTALALLVKGIGQIGTLGDSSKITPIYMIWLLSALVLGPVGGGTVCFISDLMIALVFPVGTFNPFITLGCTLYGVIAGLITKYLPVRNYVVRVLVAGTVCAFLCTFILNTFAIWGWCKYYLKLGSYIDGNNSAFGIYLSLRTFQLGIALINTFIATALVPLLVRMGLLPAFNKKEPANGENNDTETTATEE
ncbi:MAG: ECF transporter S component [Clostridiales bacterium]|nr:ECF transporter S component [Clostridiales bacterium]